MTKTTNYRSLREIADAIHTIERSSVFECGALLLEAKAGHPGEFLTWLADEFEDGISADTAERWMNVAQLDQRFPQRLRNLKVAKTTLYILSGLEEDDELEPVICRLTKESKRRWLKPAVAERFIRIERGRLKYGDRPDAALNALMKFISEDVIEALKAANPETDEAAEKIADEVVARKARAERDDADADEKEAAITKPNDADEDDEEPTDEAEASADESDDSADKTSSDDESESADKTSSGKSKTAKSKTGKSKSADYDDDDDIDYDAPPPPTTDENSQEYKDYWRIVDMPWGTIKTVGELKDYIDKALTKGAALNSKLFIHVTTDEDHDDFELIPPTVFWNDGDGLRPIMGLEAKEDEEPMEYPPGRGKPKPAQQEPKSAPTTSNDVDAAASADGRKSLYAEEPEAKPKPKKKRK
jgi:hypothetical protein